MEEVSFLFYLNLNTTKFSHVSDKLSWKLDPKDLDFQDPEPNKLLYMIDYMDGSVQFTKRVLNGHTLKNSGYQTMVFQTSRGYLELSQPEIGEDVAILCPNIQTSSKKRRPKVQVPTIQYGTTTIRKHSMKNMI